MVLYSVTVSVDAEIEAEWLEWMKRVHVPDVLRTGCFIECRVYRVVDPDAGPAHVLQYRCRTLEDYQRYRDNFAPALQKDHTSRFAGRFRASRQILEEIATFAPERR